MLTSFPSADYDVNVIALCQWSNKENIIIIIINSDAKENAVPHGMLSAASIAVVIVCKCRGNDVIIWWLELNSPQNINIFRIFDIFKIQPF